MFNFVKNFLSRVRLWLIWPIVDLQASLHDCLLRAEWAQFTNGAKNPLNRYGAKYFSQGDEDGITLEIVRRLGITAGTFAELGVGGGLENNTLILLANGWRGFWIGREDLAFDHRLNPKRLTFFKTWVSLENLTSLIQQGLKHMATNELDVLSFDLDGNDYYFVREVLTFGVLPEAFYTGIQCKISATNQMDRRIRCESLLGCH